MATKGARGTDTASRKAAYLTPSDWGQKSTASRQATQILIGRHDKTLSVHSTEQTREVRSTMRLPRLQGVARGKGNTRLINDQDT